MIVVLIGQNLEGVPRAVSVFDHTDNLHEIINIILMRDIDRMAIHEPKVVSDHRTKCSKRQPVTKNQMLAVTWKKSSGVFPGQSLRQSLSAPDIDVGGFFRRCRTESD